MQRLLAAAVAAFVVLGPVTTGWGQEVVLVGTHLMKMRDDAIPPIYPNRRRFNFRVRSGVHPAENQVVIPDPGTAGDPTLHGATFVVYNAAGSGESFTVDLPAEKWVKTGNEIKGYRYIYKSTPPILKIYLKNNKITVNGGKAAWGYTLDEPSQGLLAARLTLGSVLTWCAVAEPYAPGDPPDSSKFDRPNLYRAWRYGDPPTDCPPLPGSG